jgi:ribosomal protein S18 acetylase RimI-like enzyme
VEVTDLRREQFPDASVVMADAFQDDPGWIDVGPDDPQRRHPYTRRICHGVLKVVSRSDGGWIWCVERDGVIAGVCAGLDPGHWPPPQVPATITQAAGPLLAGPTVFWRSLKGDSAMHAGHPDEAHLFVWMLTVSPNAQRSGVGRALLSKATARADDLGVPTYLDTANPANLPYYGSHGFDNVGQTPLPRGAPLWFMLRAVR